jgi:hypothetical protein
VYLGYLFVGFSFYLLATSMLVNRKDIELNLLDICVLAYSFFILLRALIAQELFRSALGLALYTGTIPVYWVMRFVKVRSDRLAAFLFLCFLYLAACASLEIILGAPLGPVHWHYSRLSFFPHRLSSTLGSSNHFSVMLPAIAIFLTGYLLNKPGKHAAQIVILNLTTLFFVVGTSSRAGILVYLVSMLVLRFFYLPYKDRKHRVRPVPFVAVTLILLLVALFLPETEKKELHSFVSSSVDMSEWNNSVRLQKYRCIMDIASGNVKTFSVGIGLGHAGNIIHRAGLPTIFQSYGLGEFYTTESSTLKLLLETGIVGLLLFYLMLFKCIRVCQCYGPRLNPVEYRGAFLGVAGVLTLVIFRSAILQVFDVPGVLLFTWGALGYVSGVIARERDVARREKRRVSVQNAICQQTY